VRRKGGPISVLTLAQRGIGGGEKRGEVFPFCQDAEREKRDSHYESLKKGK